MKFLVTILGSVLVASTSFGAIAISCGGVDKGININSKIPTLNFQGNQTQDIEEKSIISLGDGRSVSVLLQADGNTSKSKLSIVIKGKDAKGLPLNRLIAGSLSQGVSYMELPANGMITMISCQQIEQ